MMPLGPYTVDFSVLITCHYEEASIDEFHAKLDAALAALGRSYEIIMVNDGSTDATFEHLKRIFDRNPHVRVIMDLFKNAGQQAAITAAIEEAQGKAIVIMDSDLQLDPAEISILVQEYDKGYDVVTGYRKNRKDSFLRIIPSKLANVIMRRASNSNFRDFGCTFKIYNAALVRSFRYGPRHIFSNVDLIAKTQRRCEVPITHYPRKYGKSGWTFRKLWQYNMDNVVRLSQKPFQFLAVACLLTTGVFFLRVLAGFFSAFKVFEAVTNGLLLNAIVMALLILLAVLSLIGEFTIRNFLNTQNTPVYSVRERIARD